MAKPNPNEFKLGIWEVVAYSSIDTTDEQSEELFPLIEEAVEAGFEAIKNRLAETAPQVRLELKD